MIAAEARLRNVHGQVALQVAQVARSGDQRLASVLKCKQSMRAYVVRRLLLAIVTVFLVSIIVFLMVRLIPGNIVDAIIAQQMQIGETSDNREIEAARATIEAQLGLDRPILQQYVEWISRVARGDLGNSLWRRTPVIQDIAIRWPVTLELGILGLLIGSVTAATRRTTRTST